MDEIESFCDGRCSLDIEVEEARFAEEPNSLYTCVCPAQYDDHLDDPPYLPGGGKPPGNCRTSHAAGLDCGTVSMSALHYPYDQNDIKSREYNMHSLRKLRTATSPTFCTQLTNGPVLKKSCATILASCRRPHDFGSQLQRTA